MRILPDTPSVDFLRQEAKDLLVALRESNPTASLADAQRLLAEQYGFRLWTDLKAEAERRRAEAPAGDPALADALATAFGLGEVSGPMLPISYEYMGRKWCLETTKGRFIAGPVFEWIDDRQAEVAATLREAARAAGVSAPKVVRAADGGLVKQVEGQSWRVDEWTEFGPKPMLPVRAAVARKVGEVLATLHDVAVPTDQPMGWFLTHRKPDADWQELLARARAARAGWAEELAGLMPAIVELRAVNADAVPGEHIVSIGDFMPEAVRMGKGDDLVVVHWEFAGPQVPAWELAYVLVHWVVQPEINVPGALALADGYRSRAGAFPKLDLGSFNVYITAWLNWTFNQFCEATNPESAEAAEFSEREIRDLLADPLSTAKLERLIEVLEPVMG